MTQGIRTGRTRRIREYLARVKVARTPRQILVAVEPGGDLQAICNTLSQMAHRGYVDQVGRGRGNASFRIGRVALPDARIANAAQRRAHSTAVQTTRPHQPRNNFHAAPGTVSTALDPRRAASERITADIAAFLKRGGRIQRLGVTRIFHTVDDGTD